MLPPNIPKSILFRYFTPSLPFVHFQIEANHSWNTILAILAILDFFWRGKSWPIPNSKRMLVRFPGCWTFKCKSLVVGFHQNCLGFKIRGVSSFWMVKKIGEKKLWNSEEKVIAQIENGNIGKKMKILIFAASKYS